MKKLICIILLSLFLLPVVIAFLDLYWWFWFDHKLSSIDWSGDSGLRTAIVTCMPVFSMLPFFILQDELKKDKVMRR